MHTGKSHISYIIVLFCLTCVNAIHAQDPRGSSRPGSTTTPQQPEVPKEPAYIKYYTLDDPDSKKEYADTSLANFEIYAPHRSFENGALNLGNIGSSAVKIRYEERDHIYTDMGFNQYDIYRLELEDLQYYDLNRAYNDLYFSPQDGQQNFLVKAKFSRNLADNVNILIDYERIKQEGFYLNQATKNTRFAFGISKRSEKHDLFISFIANNMNEDHNGGVTEDIDSLNNNATIRDIRTSVDTYLDEATSRHQYFSYAIDNHIRPDKLPFDIQSRMRVEHGYFRFSDDDSDSSNDSLTYRSYLTDSRGLRMVSKFVRFNKGLEFSFERKAINFSVGLDYRYLRYDNGLDVNNIHDLGLKGRLGINIEKLGALQNLAVLGIGENAGNIKLNSRLDFTAIKNVNIYAELDISRYDAFLRDQSMVVTQQRVYDNEFDKINAVVLQAGLNIEKLKLQAKLKSGIVDNPVALNTDALPYQLAGSMEFIQLELIHEFFWKFIGIENAILYQSFSDNIYQLPDIYSRHNLYLQTRLFKKRLATRLGIQYYHINYNGALAFMPITGGFYPSEQEIAYFPISELYINFQVDKFRVFLRYDNFSDMLLREAHRQIVNYPQFDANFRMGVRWIFSD